MKRNRKVFLTIVCALALVIGAIAGTMAYMTSTDKEDNVFTAGGVKIKLNEQQRNAEGTALEDFQDEKVLMPIVGDPQGGVDDFGQPVAKNYVDKIVSVENTGKSPAWIRAYFAIPSALDNGYGSFNPLVNILHFNFGNYYDAEDDKWHTTYQHQWIWKHGEDNKVWNYYETTIDGVAYNVYFADYYQPLEAGTATEELIQGVYLDKDVDCHLDDKNNYVYTIKGNTINNFDGSATCPVFAVAVQAAGFDNAEAAVNAAFGEKYNPWGGEPTNWQD